VTEFSQLYDETEAKIGLLLDNVKHILTASERQEVLDFMDAREYGLALETLSGILVEEEKPIRSSVLRQIDEIAGMMQMSDEPFVHDLHTRFDRQRRQVV
jgi:hypothetical protein